jgi:alpha-mannosidase
MRISGAESTVLFTGSAASPLQVVRVSVDTGGLAPVTARVEGPGVSTPVPAAAGPDGTAEVGIRVAAPHGPGSRLAVTVIAETAGERAELATEITAAEPGWTMWMVSHFHYDPVWWDTQGEFTQTRLLLPDSGGGLPEVRTAFELVSLHLEAARTDPDYKFVLAETDYLKPYFDTHPQDRDDLRQLMAAGRIELVGGNYNEPNTNLTSAESTIRNAVYGIGQQRDVLGGEPRTAWMLDAFGHDPGYPGLMAAAGLAESAWARGPYHQWGPQGTVGSNERMQFPSEFEWVSPDGGSLLTSYMANHYGAGWVTHQASDLPAAEAAALGQFLSLAPVAATRNVLLPVGADHVIPARWVTAIHRDWNARYLWPRFVTALPREFFAAVRADAAARGSWLTPQTRDMNPVYPGKDVTYIDTKQAQRAAETAVADGERLATLAWLAGAGYPAESLDKAWRLLVFGAHHDAITGTESDQVYLDLLGGWREAWERGHAARSAAMTTLATLADTRGPGQPVVVFNTLSWPRAGLATLTLEFAPGMPWLALRDGDGADVPFLAGHVREHPDGTLAAAEVTFRADVPALGYRGYWAVPAAERTDAGWLPMPGTVAANEAYLAEADPRHGALVRVLDQRTGTELLRGPAELVLQEEYAAHPRWGEGPWLLSPKGPGTGSAQAPATVRAERCPIGQRLVAGFRLGDLEITQETLLWEGCARVEVRTHVGGSIGQDRLLRACFPVSVPGGLPVFQAATSVVGRPPGHPDADVAEHPFTLDNPAHEWFGAGSTARVRAGGAEHAIGVAEIILPAAPGPGGLPPDWRAAIRELVAALAAAGVTATCSQPGGPRYGALDLDSNLPDCRIALGGPEHNPWTAALDAALPQAGPGESGPGESGPGESGPGESGPGESGPGESGPVWLPAGQPRTAALAAGADVRGPRDLPVLIVGGPDVPAAVRALIADLADAVIEAQAAGPSPDPPLAAHSVALLNRGIPGSLVTPDGTLCLSLMRSCSTWPCGVWIDGDRRTAPDGSSFAWQHWSHVFEYALMSGPGDWRSAGFAAAGEDYNHPLLACAAPAAAGPLPPAASLASVEPPAAAMLTALKPRGNPLAAGRPGTPDPAAGITARLRSGGQLGGGAARVRLFTGIAAARLTGLCEDTDGPALPVSNGSAAVQLPPAATVTLALTPEAGRPAPASGPARPGAAGAVTGITRATASGPAAVVTTGPAAGTDSAPAAPEPAQPVFTRYWLHGKGPAPAGNLPVAVHLSPGRVEAPGGLRLTVACGPEPAAGTVCLDVPPGLTVTGPDGQPAGELTYKLVAGGHAGWALRVRALPGTSGRRFVAARLTDSLGQTLEDAALVTVGEPAPALDLPLAEVASLVEADKRAAAAEVEVGLVSPAVAVRPGGRAEITVRLANRAASAVRGEAQLISPFGTWEAAGPWTLGFAAGAGEQVLLRYPLAVPASARPGTRWWALAKVMYFGRVHYSRCVDLRITG